jgi:hypothetical protein
MRVTRAWHVRGTSKETAAKKIQTQSLFDTVSSFPFFSFAWDLKVLTDVGFIVPP